MPANSLEAVVLIGWMHRDVAVKFLREECMFDPQLSDADATAIWQRYRSEVESLPPRAATAPIRVSLMESEKRLVAPFLEHFRKLGAQNILDVVKIDPMQLVVHQLYVVTEHAENYAKTVTTPRGWINKCVSVVSTQHNLQIRAGMNIVDVDIPHGEFGFTFVPNLGFQIQELARHVSVTEFSNRMILWAGYHRTYAKMCSAAPDANDRSLPVALTTDATFVVSPAAPNQGLREMLCGPRPPVFADFFDERFFIRVNLRRKRFQLQIRAVLVALDQ